MFPVMLAGASEGVAKAPHSAQVGTCIVLLSRDRGGG
jgi:hypothetical protein